MEELTRQELNYLIYLLESKKTDRFNTRDVEIETAKLDETDIYFLQIKLENLKK